MADSSLKRQLKVITIPVFIEIALVMLLGAVDTVMLSRYSDNSVAAVGLDNQLISLVFLVYQFFSMGAAILCAQYIGAGLRKLFDGCSHPLCAIHRGWSPQTADTGGGHSAGGEPAAGSGGECYAVFLCRRVARADGSAS